jgi:transposase InsO family protein
MADLPNSRTTISLPFTHVSLDFAGPIATVIKRRPGKNITEDTYLCIFVCHSTRATHIELSVDLRASAMKITLEKFFARSGPPTTIYSDNATNFVQIAKWLKLNQNKIDNVKTDVESDDILRSYLSELEANWIFAPPGGLHHNGLAETVVKAFKRLLIRTIGSQVLTTHELLRLLIKLKAILNARPIGYQLSSQETNLITPFHFLIGRAGLHSIADENYQTIDFNYVRFRLIDSINYSFFKAWKEQYLIDMLPRKKWLTPTDKFETNMIVILREKKAKRNRRLAKSVRLEQGSDGLTRSVIGKLASGKVLRRAINKLIPLPGIANDWSVSLPKEIATT